jgi:hypothetical protein
MTGTCKGCKWFQARAGRKQFCLRFFKEDPVRCLDFRHKQGQRVH